MERDKIQQEYRDILKQIEYLNSILASNELQMHLISEELDEIRKKYGDERRTEIVPDAKEFTMEDMIANEDVIVTISHQGFIKRTPVASYRRQNKGGRGSSGASTHDEDYIEHVFKAATHHYLLLFTDQGRVFRIKVYDIPEGSRIAKGRSIANLIPKNNDEKVTAYVQAYDFSDDEYVILVTRFGTIKKTRMSAFANVRSTGIIAVNLQDNDKLITARLTDGNCEIIIGTKNGLACRFHETDVRPMGRNAAGVIGIRLIKNDIVIGMIVIKQSDSQVIVVGENGYGKRTNYEDFRLTKRGAKGVISMNVTDKTGKVIGILTVLDTDDLVVMSQNGILIRQPVKDIRVIGRNTQGVRLIKLDDNDSIADLTIVAHEEEDNGENDEPETNETVDDSQEALL